VRQSFLEAAWVFDLLLGEQHCDYSILIVAHCQRIHTYKFHEYELLNSIAVQSQQLQEDATFRELLLEEMQTGAQLNGLAGDLCGAVGSPGKS